jgi:Putative peptidoglycan binding domain
MKIMGGSATRRYALCNFFGALLTGATVVCAPQFALAEGNGAIGNEPYQVSLGRVAPPIGAFRIADDATPPVSAPAAAPPASAPAASPPAAAPSSAPAAAPATNDKMTQENMFWESAQKSNTVADYKAYLESFPNGVYAPLAKNRIAAAAAAADGGQARSVSPDAGPAGPPAADPSQPAGPTQANAPQQENDQIAPAGAQQATAPAAISPEALRAEVGTAETEQSLNLNQRDAMVLQRRLSAIGLYSGPIDGDLGPGSRAAIVAWQQSHGVAPTGQLGPLQLAALQAESAPVNGQRVGGQGCPPGFHPGPYGRRCWANR